MWMSEYEIAEVRGYYRDHPLLGPATATLENLMNAVNGGSDGWPYWKAPSRSAGRLMDLIQAAMRTRNYDSDPRAALAQYRKALTPIRAFRTRSGLDFVIVEAR